MKDFDFPEIPDGESLIQIKDEEFALLQACLFFCAPEYDTMTKDAQKVFDRLQKKMNMDRRVGSLTVWK